MGTGMLRSRWAAIGAAVAVTLGLGGTWIADAATSSPPGSLITIVPCRLMDTRTGSDNVGPRSAPLAAATPYVATVWGTNGNCTIPSTAVAVVMNVTVVNPTSASWLAVYPSDATLPLASSLNYSAGQAATPNAVTVRLSADGKVAFYNVAGTVDVIADIVGYYDPATAGPQGPKGDTGDTGMQGPVGPLPTVYVGSLTTCCTAIADTAVGEANAKPIVSAFAPTSGSYLVRVDAQLKLFGSLWFDYHCKLQSIPYPHLLGTPYTDIPATRRDVSWRTGKDNSGNTTSATGVSISMQAPVTAGSFGVDVRMMCWGTFDTSGPLYDYGSGVESAVLTLERVGGVA